MNGLGRRRLFEVHHLAAVGDAFGFSDGDCALCSGFQGCILGQLGQGQSLQSFLVDVHNWVLSLGVL